MCAREVGREKDMAKKRKRASLPMGKNLCAKEEMNVEEERRILSAYT